MPTPSPGSFAALARSSPWLWSTLRFTVRWPGDPFRAEALRAWLRRPEELRVETVEGDFRQVVHERRATAAVLSMPPTGEITRTYPWPAEAEAPLLRPDGLVDSRPPHVSYDAPMYRDYSWVAMLDPVELADEVVVESVDEVEHAGRPTWAAVVRTTQAYEPRCGCCPLLRSREIDLLEYGPDSELLRPAYPEAFRVGLDLATGVCVSTREVGGPTPGSGHDLRIEAVDEPMDDDLFVEPRRGLFRRRQ